MTIQVAMHGAAGRMGLSIVRQLMDASQAAGASLAAALEHDAHPRLGQGVAGLVGLAGCVPKDVGDLKFVAARPEALAHVDVVIDFSTPDGTARVAQWCTALSKPLVVGTTGLHDAARRALAELATRAPVVVAPNMSVGVNVMFYLAGEAARLLGASYDIEIVEMHHRRKVDAPSGTAQGLYQAVTAARGLDPERAYVHGRSGQVGARTPGEVGVLALRGGDVVGDHTVVFAGEGERVELTHRAHHRDIFAQGAIRAALWAVKQKPGEYTMMDVLGIAR
jgi:4-hydroxy-tetrahydrodipicolinate reductase